MRNTVLGLLLALASVPMAGADPIKLTASDPVTFLDGALAQHHLGFRPVGDNFLFSADFEATPSDTFPNGGTFRLDPGQLRFTENSGGEFISAFTGDALVLNGPPTGVDVIRFDMEPMPFASHLFEFVLEFHGPGSWLNGVELSPSAFVMSPPFTQASFGARSVVGADGVEFLRGTVQTVTAALRPFLNPQALF